MSSTCGRLGWPEEDQDYDNPCECGLAKGHDGLHECHSGCGAQWAGGRAPESHDAEQSDAMCAFCHRLTSKPYETPDGDVICDDCAEPESHASEATS